MESTADLINGINTRARESLWTELVQLRAFADLLRADPLGVDEMALGQVLHEIREAEKKLELPTPAAGG